MRPTNRRPLIAFAPLMCLCFVACGEPDSSPEPAPAADAPRELLSPWRVPESVLRPALRYERFETIGVAEGLPSERVTAVLVEGDRLAVGTEHGIALRNGGVWSTLDEDDGLSHDYVTSLARDPATGDLWIATLRGLNRLSGGRVQSFLQTDSGLMNDVVYHVVVDGGLVWAATAAGASVFDTRTNTWDLYDTGNSIMHEPWCYALATGPGRTWIGVWGGGVVELDHTTGRWREYRDPDGEMELDVLRDDGPIHEVTSFVAYDAGVLWQSTYFGLSRYDGRRWQTYVAADTGLPGDFIAQVHARGHTVWLATDQGLGVFDGTTCVTYRRSENESGEDSGGEEIVWEDGAEVSRRHLATGPPDDYLLWVQGGDRDVWFATAKGLCHGMAEGYVAPSPNETGDTE